MKSKKDQAISKRFPMSESERFHMERNYQFSKHQLDCLLERAIYSKTLASTIDTCLENIRKSTIRLDRLKISKRSINLGKWYGERK